MTDEEMAEEYTSNLLKGVNCNIGNPRARQINSIDVEEAFLAGLKAGRPEWHDLRKDPNDLPKEDYETVTLHENGNKNIIKWKYGNWTNAIIIPVIAWCEIPTFTDKE